MATTTAASDASTKPLPTIEEDNKEKTVKKRGIVSRIFNGIFRIGRSDDFEKRLQYITKEEASVLARKNKRSRNWRGIARNLIVLSAIIEVAAVCVAIITTRSVDLNWKMRAIRVLPMFILPGLSSLIYFTIKSYIMMCDRKDQKTLERLRDERQAKINELKERTNYYTTQQLIQRYDPDPAAKAAAASVLASKLGADSGLKVYLGEKSMLNTPVGKDNDGLNTPLGKSNDVELAHSKGLRNRKQSHSRSNSTGNIGLPQFMEEAPGDIGYDGTETPPNQTVVVDHHPRSTAHDSGWFARIAALLVGEDPTQSYALICGSCHMHNGLARKEDFPFITYYCPHCHALNRSRQQEELAPNSSSTSTTFSERLSDVDPRDSIAEDKPLSADLTPAVETVPSEEKVSDEPVH